MGGTGEQGSVWNPVPVGKGNREVGELLEEFQSVMQHIMPLS